MPPLTTECVQSKEDSSAVLTMTAKTLQMVMRWWMSLLATKDVRGKGSFSAMLRMTAETLQMIMRWGMPPLATKGIRGRGSSDARTPRSAVQYNKTLETNGRQNHVRTFSSPILFRHLYDHKKSYCVKNNKYNRKIWRSATRMLRNKIMNSSMGSGTTYDSFRRYRRASRNVEKKWWLYWCS